MENLIEIVRENPILYDTSHPEYLRTKIKDTLWNKIAIEMNYTDGNAAKEHWRKLRDCHREALRRQQKKNGQEMTIIRPWIYQKSMEFLLPFMKNRTSVEPPNTSLFEEDQAEEEEATILHLTSVEISQSEDDKDQIVESPAPKKMKKTTLSYPLMQRFIEDSEKKAVNKDKIQQNLQGQQTQLQNDALYHFFMSMYNITKDLPSRYHKQVRRKVFDVVLQAEDESESEVLKSTK